MFHSENHIETPFVPDRPLVNEDGTINNDFANVGEAPLVLSINKQSKTP